MIKIQSNFECMQRTIFDDSLAIVYQIFDIAASSGNTCWADRGGAAPKQISVLLSHCCEDELCVICAIIDYVSSARLHLVQYGTHPTLALRAYYEDYRKKDKYRSIKNNLESESPFVDIRKNFLLKYPEDSEPRLLSYSTVLRDLTEPYIIK